MPGQFLLSAVMALLFALLLAETFPPRRPAAAVTLVPIEAPAPPAGAQVSVCRTPPRAADADRLDPLC